MNELPSVPCSIPPTPQSDPLAVDVHEVARITSLSPRTIWKLTASGELPSLRVGRRVLYRVESVRTFLAQREQRKHTS